LWLCSYDINSSRYVTACGPIAKLYGIRVDIIIYINEIERFPYGFHMESICGINMTFAMYNPDGTPSLTVYCNTVVVNTFVSMCCY